MVPGLTQRQFPDNGVIELPGLYRDLRGATAFFTKHTAAGVPRGYEDSVVLGAFATEAESIHTRVRALSASSP